MRITRKAVKKKYHVHACLYDMDELFFLGAKQTSRKKLIALAGKMEGKLVLDVMAGTGELSLLAARAGGNVIGVDFSKPMLKIAKKKAIREALDNILFANANAEKLPFPENHFDIVICSFGLDTAYDPEAVVLEMKHVVKKDGIIVAAYKSFPVTSMVNVLEKGIEIYLKYFWQSKSVDAKLLFTRAGYKIIKEAPLFYGLVTVIKARKESP